MQPCTYACRHASTQTHKTAALFCFLWKALQLQDSLHECRRTDNSKPSLPNIWDPIYVALPTQFCTSQVRWRDADGPAVPTLQGSRKLECGCFRPVPPRQSCVHCGLRAQTAQLEGQAMVHHLSAIAALQHSAQTSTEACQALMQLTESDSPLCSFFSQQMALLPCKHCLAMT